MISSWVSLIFKLNWTFSISVTSHLVLTLSILCRWISSNHFPLSNLHESLIFLAWIFSLLCVFEYKTFVPLLVTQSVSTKHLGPASLRDSGPPDQLGKHLETVSRPVGSSVSEGNTERSPVPLGQPLGADELKGCCATSEAGALRAAPFVATPPSEKQQQVRREETLSLSPTFWARSAAQNPSKGMVAQQRSLELVAVFPKEKQVVPSGRDVETTGTGALGVVLPASEKQQQVLVNAHRRPRAAQEEQRRGPLPREVIVVIFSPIVVFLVGFGQFLLPSAMTNPMPLVPALQSNWLLMHVSTMLMSYGALISGCLLAFAYLISNEIGLQTFFDQLSYRMLALGFPLLTLGILSGSIWANASWGSFWSWDPKETWALANWIIFAIYLHSRFVKGWQGSKPAIIACFGFLTLLICFLGVNVFGKGLHNYSF